MKIEKFNKKKSFADLIKFKASLLLQEKTTEIEILILLDAKQLLIILFNYWNNDFKNLRMRSCLHPVKKFITQHTNLISTQNIYEKTDKQLKGFYHWRNHKKTFSNGKLSDCLQQT